MADEDFKLGDLEEEKISKMEQELQRRTMRGPSSSPNGNSTPSKPRTLMGRLFGSSSPKSDIGEESGSKTQESFRVDLSQGAMKGKELFESGKVSKSLNDQLKGAGVRDASTRNAVKGMIMGKRGQGLNREELRKGLKEMRDEGKISRVQERNIRKDLGITKRPGLF